MPDDVQEFTHESLQDRDSIVKYLSALGACLQQGRLMLSSNGQSLSLETPQLVKFDVQAKQKRDRTQLVVKLSWKSPKAGKKLRVEPLKIDPGDSAG
jgi:amphi-Trp domain-containing protein